MIKDNCTYLLKLRGQVTESEINAMSPLQLTVTQTDVDTTLLTVCTDQSGLVGLMRHLHGVGFLFLSVDRIETPNET